MEKIAFLDGDPALVQSLRTLLPAQQYELIQYHDFVELLDRLSLHLLVVADPRGMGVDGQHIMGKIHATHPELALIFIAAGLDMDLAVELMKGGAFDCISLPCDLPALAARIEADCRRAKEKAFLKATELEQICVDIENRQIMNWRNMYASKEIVQTEHLIHEMATNINSSGGYEWLDLLQSMAIQEPDGQYTVPKDVYDLILESAGSQRKFFDFVTFLSRLDKMTIDKAEHGAVEFIAACQALVVKQLKEFCVSYERPFRLSFPEPGSFVHGYVCQDMAILARCLRELIINAIKYSPEKSPLVAGLDIDESGNLPVLNLWLRNQPRQYQAKDAEGNHIVGVPHEYSELVFDLFYTIEAYPNKLPEEEWTDGAGLFIARKLFRRQGGWLSTSNGVDYTRLKAEPYIKFNISLPLHRKRDFARCNPKCSPCSFMLLKGRV